MFTIIDVYFLCNDINFCDSGDIISIIFVTLQKSMQWLFQRCVAVKIISEQLMALGEMGNAFPPNIDESEHNVW